MCLCTFSHYKRLESHRKSEINQLLKTSWATHRTVPRIHLKSLQCRPRRLFRTPLSPGSPLLARKISNLQRLIPFPRLPRRTFSSLLFSLLGGKTGGSPHLNPHVRCLQRAALCFTTLPLRLLPLSGVSAKHPRLSRRLCRIFPFQFSFFAGKTGHLQLYTRDFLTHIFIWRLSNGNFWILSPTSLDTWKVFIY